MPNRRHDFDLDAYTRRVRTGSCFICEIVSGGDAGVHAVVYRDDVAIAFLNRYPTLLGYTLVAPVQHRVGVVESFSEDEYLQLQRVIRRVGLAVSSVVPTERLYVLSLGSNDGNAHVHWHLAPLPPGVPYEEQQLRALMIESAGYLDVSIDEQQALAASVREALGSA
jgi:diadenosine tetraphosphate (Ap4A) HIT family hydrolase